MRASRCGRLQQLERGSVLGRAEPGGRRIAALRTAPTKRRAVPAEFFQRQQERSQVVLDLFTLQPSSYAACFDEGGTRPRGVEVEGC